MRQSKTFHKSSNNLNQMQIQMDKNKKKPKDKIQREDEKIKKIIETRERGKKRFLRTLAGDWQCFNRYLHVFFPFYQIYWPIQDENTKRPP